MDIQNGNSDAQSQAPSPIDVAFGMLELGYDEHDDTASLTDAAARILGRTLGVQLAGYGAVDPDSETLTIERDWTDGVASLAGTLRLRDFGSYIEDIKRGETVAVPDVRLDPRTRDHAAALEPAVPAPSSTCRCSSAAAWWRCSSSAAMRRAPGPRPSCASSPKWLRARATPARACRPSASCAN